MATVRKSVKRAAPKQVRAKTTQKARPAATAASRARQALSAGMGAANRVQSEALKVYEVIAAEAARLAEMTSGAREALAATAGALMGDGQKIQSRAASTAQARAASVAKELKAFAAKSEQSFKRNVQGSIANAVAGAKDGAANIEQIFESRVAKTLNTFGIPTRQDVRLLQARMADLQKALNQLNKRVLRG